MEQLTVQADAWSPKDSTPLTQSDFFSARKKENNVVHQGWKGSAVGYIGHSWYSSGHYHTVIGRKMERKEKERGRWKWELKKICPCDDTTFLSPLCYYTVWRKIHTQNPAWNDLSFFGIVVQQSHTHTVYNLNSWHYLPTYLSNTDNNIIIIWHRRSNLIWWNIILHTKTFFTSYISYVIGQSVSYTFTLFNIIIMTWVMIMMIRIMITAPPRSSILIPCMMDRILDDFIISVSWGIYRVFMYMLVV